MIGVPSLHPQSDRWCTRLRAFLVYCFIRVRLILTRSLRTLSSPFPMADPFGVGASLLSVGFSQYFLSFFQAVEVALSLILTSLSFGMVDMFSPCASTKKNDYKNY